MTAVTIPPTASKGPRGDALLDIASLAVSAGGKVLLGGLDLRLRAGQLVALVGPSGCGKTTLLRALCGLCDVAAGELRLRGRTPEQWGLPAWRRRVTYLAQRPALLVDGTVREELGRPFEYRTAGGKGLVEARATELLGELGLPEHVLSQQARTLSEGELQRVCLARVLLLEPEVLLLDEPTSALDPEAVAAAERALRQAVAARGAAALVVTHDPAQAERLGDWVVDLGELGRPEGGHHA